MLGVAPLVTAKGGYAQQDHDLSDEYTASRGGGTVGISGSDNDEAQEGKAVEKREKRSIIGS